MVLSIILAGLQYGVPAVGALFSYLAHRKAKQIHAVITGQPKPDGK